MFGQGATGGRLEVTALGDQMNECARIEAAAKDVAILTSKDLIERLDAAAGAAGCWPPWQRDAARGSTTGTKTDTRVRRDAGFGLLARLPAASAHTQPLVGTPRAVGLFAA